MANPVQSRQAPGTNVTESEGPGTGANFTFMPDAIGNGHQDTCTQQQLLHAVGLNHDFDGITHITIDHTPTSRQVQVASDRPTDLLTAQGFGTLNVRMCRSYNNGAPKPRTDRAWKPVRTSSFRLFPHLSFCFPPFSGAYHSAWAFCLHFRVLFSIPVVGVDF